MRDVLSSFAGTDPESPLAVRYSLSAESYPGLLPRLIEPFAKRGLVPDRLSSHQENGVLRVEVGMDAMPSGMVHLVAGNLGQVIGVFDLRVAREAALAAVA